MRHTISIDHLWKTSGQSLTNVQGLRGDRTWYTKERAGVPNLIGWRLVQERVALVYETTLGGCWYTKRSFPVRNYLAMTVGIQEERSVYGLYVGIHSSNASLRAA